MSITIKHKKSAVAASKPTGAQIDNGEIAINYSDTDPALYIKDSTGAVIRVAGNGAVGGISSSAAAPTTPADGDTWVDTSVHPPSMKVWDATASKWEVIGASGSGTAPATPATGAVWLDTSTVPNVIKVWDGGNWVSQTGATIIDPVAPTAPATGQMWVDTSTSPSPIKIWDGSGWVTTAATGAASQTLANDAKYATKAEVQAEDLWDRTGTEIHPKTAGDDVFTSGDVKVGGTTAAPKTSLKNDGSAEFASDVKIGGTLPASPNISLNDDGSAEFAGNVKIGGTFPASPKIQLKPDGTVVTVNNVYGRDFVAATENDGFSVFESNNLAGGETIRLIQNGSAKFAGDVKIGGTLPSAPNISLEADGSAKFKALVQITAETGTDTCQLSFGRPSALNQGYLRYDNNIDALYLRTGGSSNNLLIDANGSFFVGGTLGYPVIPNAPNISLKSDGNIQAVRLAAAGRIYADNTAAKAGGLVDGDFYRKADGTLMIAYT